MERSIYDLAHELRLLRQTTCPHETYPYNHIGCFFWQVPLKNQFIKRTDYQQQ